MVGAKNLKAIVVSGLQDVTVNQGEKCLQAIFTLKNKFNGSPYTKEYLPDTGNGFLLDICLDKKVLPANNFKLAAQKIPNLDGQGIRDFTSRRRACFSCPIGCLRFSLEKERMSYLDYESIAGFGYLCGIKAIDKIATLRHLCTELGLDVLNTASTIACAMELGEEGVFKDVPLTFGCEDVENIIKQIGKNKGAGAKMAKGGAHLAKSLDRPARFMGVKNMAIPPFEPRKLWDFGFYVATSNSGAYHLNGFTVMEELSGIHQIDYHSDILPERFTQEPLEGHVCPLDQMLPIYYQERGWDECGRPKEETLNRLGLKDAKDKDRA